MRKAVLTIAALMLGTGLDPAFVLRAEHITGTILIRKTLTKRSVASQVSLYQRGPEVPLENNFKEDPLDYERSRVAIWLEGAALGGSAPGLAAQATMQQTGRRFVPDLLVVPVGSTVAFPNLDQIFHNVFSLSKPKSFDLGNYVKGDSRVVTFAKPGIVYVNCHLHPNMSAAIVVTPNQWYATAGKDGRYTLPDVPPGVYTAVAWHKAAGLFKKTVQVQPGRGALVDFFIPIGEGETLESPRMKVHRVD